MKTHAQPINRRRFLRNAGVVIALPMMESLIPRAMAQAAARKPVKRFVCLSNNYGVYPQAFFPAKGARPAQFHAHHPGRRARAHTPSEGSDGRDHSPFGYLVWMAGGDIKGGAVFGATDDFGFKAIENPVQVRDLHATILQLPGLRHDKLTYYFQGLQQRLTQVDGESRVIKEVIT